MVQLQKDSKDIEAAKIQVVGISYDSVDVLKSFAKRFKVKFPVLSDTDSKVIEAYGVLNKRARGRSKGVPHPVTIIIGSDGKVKAKIPGTVRKRHSTKALIDAAKKNRTTKSKAKKS